MWSTSAKSRKEWIGAGTWLPHQLYESERWDWSLEFLFSQLRGLYNCKFVDWVVSKDAWVWFSWIATLWFYFCYFWSTPRTCNSMSFGSSKTHLTSSSPLYIAHRHRISFCDWASSYWSLSKQPIKNSVSPFRLRKRYRQPSDLRSYFDWP